MRRLAHTDEKGEKVASKERVGEKAGVGAGASPDAPKPSAPAPRTAASGGWSVEHQADIGAGHGLLSGVASGL